MKINDVKKGTTVMHPVYGQVALTGRYTSCPSLLKRGPVLVSVEVTRDPYSVLEDFWVKPSDLYEIKEAV